TCLHISTSPTSSYLHYLLLTISPSSFLSIPFLFFFFNDTPTTEIYTLSLHDALPISHARSIRQRHRHRPDAGADQLPRCLGRDRSEEHTSELQSLTNLVCRLLLEKKKKTNIVVTDKTMRTLSYRSELMLSKTQIVSTT